MGIKQSIENYINVLAENKKKCVHNWQLLSKVTYKGQKQVNDGYIYEVDIDQWTYRCKKCGQINKVNNRINS